MVNSLGPQPGWIYQHKVHEIYPDLDLQELERVPMHFFKDVGLWCLSTTALEAILAEKRLRQQQLREQREREARRQRLLRLISIALLTLALGSTVSALVVYAWTN